MINFQEYHEINEELKIIKKNWKSDFSGYRVEYYDTQDHALIPKIQERTDLTLNEIKAKLDKAISYIIKKMKKGFFKKKESIAIVFKKSEFKAGFLVDPSNNYIRVNTILSKEMTTDNNIVWELNESELV